MSKHTMILEISNATDQQVQSDLGQAFHEFCQKNKGAGITASVLTDSAAEKIKEFIEE